jgi:hypothetical protein
MICDRVTNEYLSRDNRVGWKLNATGSAECAEQIRAESK